MALKRDQHFKERERERERENNILIEPITDYEFV